MNTDLRRTNLNSADLSGTLIINPFYDKKIILDENTTFSDGITDNTEFIDFVTDFTKSFPEKLKNKKVLKIKLQERKYDDHFVADVLSKSILPE
jgi:hypothetical protein